MHNIRVRRCFLIASVLIMAASSAWATPDFFGVKMKSEDFAQNVILRENFKIPDFTNNRPGTDKRIYAYAFASTTVGGGKGLSLQVYNHSDKPIATSRLFRDLTLVTGDGKRYDRSEAEMMFTREELLPGQDATFNFKFPGVAVPKEDIRLIICSFDMGATKIFLFPLNTEKKDALKEKKAETKKSEVKLPEPKKTVAKKAPAKKTAPKKPQAALQNTDQVPAKADETKKPEPSLWSCPAPVKTLSRLFDRLINKAKSGIAKDATSPEEAGVEEAVEKEDAASGKSSADGDPADAEASSESTGGVTASDAEDQALPPSYPLVKSEQVLDGIHFNFKPNFRQEAQEAQKFIEEVIHRDRPWSMTKPDQYLPHQEAFEFPSWGVPRRMAQVVIVKDDVGFVIINAGYEDGFEKSTILDVLRNGRKIGKVMVVKVRDKVAGAIILSEWRTRETIRVGDQVGVSV